jgi:hypothetical protein
MKLYTLEFQVDFPRTPEEIAESVEIALSQEAELRGWKNGYTFSECQPRRQLASGGVVHTYEVEGLYSNPGDDSGSDISRKGAHSQQKKPEGQVARPSEINQ